MRGRRLPRRPGAHESSGNQQTWRGCLGLRMPWAWHREVPTEADIARLRGQVASGLHGLCMSAELSHET